MTTSPTIEKLINHVTSECRKLDPEEQFREMLDECYSFKSVGGIFSGMCPSRVLEMCDETAFRCGCNDYADSCGWLEIGNDYYDSDDVEKARESFIEELENQIADLETEREEAELDDKAAEAARIQRQIQDLEADAREAKDYSF